MASNNEAALVARSLKGDRTAFDRLVQVHQQDAFGLAISFVRSPDDAEEVVQDAFVTAYLRLESLKKSHAFGAWFRTILVNRARQLLRKRGIDRTRYPVMDSAVAEIDREADIRHEKQQRQKAVSTGLVDLPDIYRAPLALHYYAGFSYEEIACFLDVPLSTVRGRLQKGRRRLRHVISEERAVMNVDMSEKISEIICRIARNEIKCDIEPDASKHLFLSFDVPTELHLRSYQGSEIRIRGYKTAVGYDQEKAETALSKIQLRNDYVDDWASAGGHEGEVFGGVEKYDEGMPVTRVEKGGGPVRIFEGGPVPYAFNINLGDVFPHLEPDQDLLQRMRTGMPTEACRVSLVYEKLFDLNLPHALFSEEVAEGFGVNYRENEYVQGPIGKARLDIEVPEGMHVTVRGRLLDGSDITHLQGNLLIYGEPMTLQDAAKVEHIQGDVYVLNAGVSNVRHVSGHVRGYHHLRRMGNWSLGKHHAPEPYPMRLAHIAGDIELDLGHIALEIHEPKGKVFVENRTGATTVSATAWHENAQWRLESRSGNIRIEMSEDQLRRRWIAGSSLSGAFDFSIIADLLGAHLTSNTQQMMLFSTPQGNKDGEIDFLNAEILAKSESGDVSIAHPDS